MLFFTLFLFGVHRFHLMRYQSREQIVVEMRRHKTNNNLWLFFVYLVSSLSSIGSHRARVFSIDSSSIQSNLNGMFSQILNCDRHLASFLLLHVCVWVFFFLVYTKNFMAFFCIHIFRFHSQVEQICRISKCYLIELK